MLLIVLTVLFMEFMAWLSHKYLMHGALWCWHADHHDKRLVRGFFEHNDKFAIMYAVPSSQLIFWGLNFKNYFSVEIGIGIAAYGFIYFLIHDVYIHERFRFLKFLDALSYFRIVKYAHQIHHKNMNREDGESFGMLWVSSRYFEQYRQ